MFLKARYSYHSSARSTVRILPIEAGNSLFLERNTAELHRGDPPEPDIERNVVVDGKVIPVSLSVRRPPVCTFGLVSRTGHSRSMTGVQPPKKQDLLGIRLLVGAVEALSG